MILKLNFLLLKTSITGMDQFYSIAMFPFEKQSKNCILLLWGNRGPVINDQKCPPPPLRNSKWNFRFIDWHLTCYFSCRKYGCISEQFCGKRWSHYQRSYLDHRIKMTGQKWSLWYWWYCSKIVWQLWNRSFAATNQLEFVPFKFLCFCARSMVGQSNKLWWFGPLDRPFSISALELWRCPEIHEMSSSKDYGNKSGISKRFCPVYAELRFVTTSGGVKLVLDV